jgi:hypothetical protein
LGVGKGNSEKVFHADGRRGLVLLVGKDQRESARKKKNTSHADERRLNTQIFADENTEGRRKLTLSMSK